MHGVRPHFHAQAAQIQSAHNAQGKFLKGMGTAEKRKAAEKVAYFSHAEFRDLMKKRAEERREARMLGRA